MNIYQKLIEVRKKVEYLKKENKGSQYSYVSSSQVLGNIRKQLDEQNLLLIPSIVSTNVRENATKTGTLSYFTELTMNMIWINADKPDEKIEVPFYAQGVDLAGEKGVGKALTYAEKYFLLKSFNIATDKDDPDAFQKKHEEVKLVDDNMIKSLHTRITKKGITNEQKYDYLKKNFNIDSSKALNVDQYKKMMDDLAKMPDKKEESK